MNKERKKARMKDRNIQKIDRKWREEVSKQERKKEKKKQRKERKIKGNKK